MVVVENFFLQDVSGLLAFFYRNRALPRSSEQQGKELGEGLKKSTQEFFQTRAPSLLFVAMSWTILNKKHVGEHY
jgi:hypothetical protein